ncbi:MAG: hypothetical protein LBE37_20385 [Sphingobacterium sp.]|nr:hypothetical protein [Sphingobacterium sp.]
MVTHFKESLEKKAMANKKGRPHYLPQPPRYDQVTKTLFPIGRPSPSFCKNTKSMGVGKPYVLCLLNLVVFDDKTRSE